MKRQSQFVKQLEAAIRPFSRIFLQFQVSYGVFELNSDTASNFPQMDVDAGHQRVLDRSGTFFKFMRFAWA